ncbi:MAG: hypothetical protein HYX67_14440 [Candidatus Melainabacteria bacterium]|nr:hypothetical protein [Candidatus Melainabacteria bacterium]
MPPGQSEVAPLSAHDQLVRQFEHDFTDQYKKDPNDKAAMSKVFEELQKLHGIDGSDERFQADMRMINKFLEDKGVLPKLEIDEDPNNPNNPDGFKIGPMDPASPDSPSNEKASLEQAGDSGGSGSGGYDGSASNDGSGGAAYNPGFSGQAGFDGYDATVDPNNQTQNSILDTAATDVGHAMWKQINGGASGGNEGCAASVSAVLDQAGVANVSEMECHHLQSALQGQGWSLTNKPQPGDVVIGYGGLSAAHTGIVGKNGTVFDNHSSTGTWQQDQLSYFKNWNQVVFLHKDAPATPAPAAHAPAPAATGTHH